MKFIGNLSEKKWKIEHEEDYADEIIIDIGFTEKEKDVKRDNTKHYHNMSI
jgi:hypothetical protein